MSAHFAMMKDFEMAGVPPTGPGPGPGQNLYLPMFVNPQDLILRPEAALGGSGPQPPLQPAYGKEAALVSRSSRGGPGQSNAGGSNKGKYDWPLIHDFVVENGYHEKTIKDHFNIISNSVIRHHFLSHERGTSKCSSKHGMRKK